MDTNAIIETLYKMYDKIAQLEQAHKAQVLEIKDQAEFLENKLLEFMKVNNIDKLSSPIATFSKGMKTYVNIDDWDACSHRGSREQ